MANASFAGRMRRLRTVPQIPQGIPIERMGERARTACERRLWRVSDGHVSWWVQAHTCWVAGSLVRKAMHDAGISIDEIASYFRAHLSITSQTWEQGASTPLGDSPSGANMLSLFVGGRDEVIACSEW